MKNIYLILGATVLFMVASNKDKILINTPTPFDDYFQKYGSMYGVDWTMLKKICYIESSYGLDYRVARGLLNPNDIEGSKSSDGKSWGIMQLQPSTARQFDITANEIKLNNAEYSVKIAAQYFAWAQKYLAKKISPSNPRFLEYLVKSYNQGVGNTSKEILLGTGFADDYYAKFNNLTV